MDSAAIPTAPAKAEGTCLRESPDTVQVAAGEVSLSALRTRGDHWPLLRLRVVVGEEVTCSAPVQSALSRNSCPREGM